MLINAPLVLFSINGFIGSCHIWLAAFGLVLNLSLHVLAVFHQEHAGVTGVEEVVASLNDF